jgi:hypothetical protein
MLHRCLWMLCSHPPNVSTLVGAIPAVLAALETHPSRVGVVQAAVGSLHSLASQPLNTPHMRVALPALRRAARNHPGVPSIDRAALATAALIEARGAW